MILAAASLLLVCWLVCGYLVMLVLTFVFGCIAICFFMV